MFGFPALRALRRVGVASVSIVLPSTAILLVLFGGCSEPSEGATAFLFLVLTGAFLAVVLGFTAMRGMSSPRDARSSLLR